MEEHSTVSLWNNLLFKMSEGIHHYHSFSRSGWLVSPQKKFGGWMEILLLPYLEPAPADDCVEFYAEHIWISYATSDRLL